MLKMIKNENYNFEMPLGAIRGPARARNIISNTIKPNIRKKVLGFFISNRFLIPNHSELQTSVPRIKQVLCHVLLMCPIVFKVKIWTNIQWCWKQHDGFGYPS